MKSKQVRLDPVNYHGVAVRVATLKALGQDVSIQSFVNEAIAVHLAAISEQTKEPAIAS